MYAFCLSPAGELEEVGEVSDLHRTSRKWRCSAALALAVGCCFPVPGRCAASEPESNALPRIASAPTSNALAGLYVKPGFRLELVAEDRAVTAPVAMAFDENGRLFVVERPEEPEGRGANGPAGRIRLFEDTEGTGELHATGIYADNLPWA